MLFPFPSGKEFWNCLKDFIKAARLLEDSLGVVLLEDFVDVDASAFPVAIDEDETVEEEEAEEVEEEEKEECEG